MLKSTNQKKVSQLPQPGLAVLNGSDDHTGRKRKRQKEKKGGGISCLNWTWSSWQGEVVFLTLAKPDYFLKGMKKKEM